MSTLTFFPDLYSEDRASDELATRRRMATVMASRADPETARRLARLSSYYAGLSGGVLTAAAVGGFEPGDPSLDQIYVRSVQADAADQKLVEEQARKYPWDWGWSATKTVSRVFTTALDAIYKEGLVGTTSFATTLAQQAFGPEAVNVERAARGSYGFSAGAIAAASLLQGREVNLGSGLTYDQSPLTPEAEAALRAVGGLGGLGRLTPEQARSFLNLLETPEQAALGMPAFLYGELKRQAQGTRIGVTATNPGVPVTPGRLAAITVSEPGSGSFNFLSGVGDFAANLFLDPSIIPLRALGAARQANRLLLPDAVRPTGLERSATNFLASPYGRSINDWFTGETDYQRVYGALRHSVGGRRVNAKLALDLTLSNNTVNTGRILNQAVQEGVVTKVPGGQSMLGRGVSALTGAPIGSVSGTLGGALIGRPTIGRLAGTGLAVSQAAHGTVLGRWAMTLGHRDLDSANVDEAVEAFGTFLRLADFDQPATSRFMARLADITPGSVDEAYPIWNEAMSAFAETMKKAGMRPEAIRPITRFFSEVPELRGYFDDLLGRPAYTPTGPVTHLQNGGIEIQPHATIFTEMLDRTLPLPDPRDVRRAVRELHLVAKHPALGRLTNSSGAEVGRWLARAGDFAMSSIWKPMVLLRLAYAVRILGEEQLRMGAAGLNTFVHHPAQYLALLTGRRAKGTLVDDLATETANLRAALTNGGAWLGTTPHGIGSAGTSRGALRRRIEPFEYITYRKGVDEPFQSAWTGKLAHLWNDELGSSIARSTLPLPPPTGRAILTDPLVPALPAEAGVSADAILAKVGEAGAPHPGLVLGGDSLLDDVKQRFWDGDLAPYRRRLVADNPRLRSGLADDAPTGRAVADAHIEMMWARINQQAGGRFIVFSPRIGGWRDDLGNGPLDLPPPIGYRDTYVITQPGDPRLIEAIGTGELDGLKLVDADEITYGRINEHLSTNYLDSAPERVKGPRPPDAPDLVDGWNKMVRGMFHVLIGAPSDTLSRAPAWKQFYWRRVSEVMPLMDETTRLAVIERAAAQGFSAKEIRGWMARVRAETTFQADLSSGEYFFHGTTATAAAAIRREGFREGGFATSAATARGTAGSDGAVLIFRRSAFPEKLQSESAINRIYDDRFLNAEDLSRIETGELYGTMGRVPKPVGMIVNGDVTWFEKAITDPPITTMAGADLMGKAYATEETQRLLFDLSRRRNFFDVMRLLLPFGEAWNEIITTWRRLLVDNPAIIRRGSQALNGARSSGFIYTDPGTGEEVFNYGGAYGPESLGQLLFGGDVNLLPLGGDRAVATLTGRVAGLNLVSGNWLPGFGPVVQLPLAQLDWVQTDPKWEWFRELVFPFGAPEADTPGALADSLLPTWVKRGLAAIGRPVGSDVRSFNYTVVDTIRAMKLSGEWKDSTQAEINTSLRIATDRAKSLYFIRALSAFVGPTPAGVRWDAKLDPDGRLLAFTVLAQEYRAIREQTRAAGGQDTDAFDTFVQRFGVDPLLFSTAKSTTLVSRSVTKEGVDFQASHQELFADFPLTAYFALPDPVDGTFDQRAYTSQFLDQPGIGAPARVPLTPAQWTELHNQLAGEMMYERAKRAVDGRSDEAAQAWLRAVKAQIMEAYPGFGGDIVGTPTRARREEMIVELYGWRADPFLAETETGRGLALYLAARDLVAVESAKRGIVGWQRAEGTTDLRSWLATVAQSVMMKLPEFAAVYDRVLSSEVEIPGEEPSTELAGISLQPVSP